MIEVTFESTDPKLAATVANALVSNYAEYSFHTKYDATRQASGWMEQQLDEWQKAIVNLGDKQNVVEQRLACNSLPTSGSSCHGRESIARARKGYRYRYCARATTPEESAQIQPPS